MKTWVKLLFSGIVLLALVVVIIVGLQKFACIGSCNRFVYSKDDLLGGDLKIVSNAAVIDAKYSQFIKAIYTLNQAADNGAAMKKVGITSPDELVKFAKSGKPISGLYLPVGNAKKEDALKDFQQSYMWSKLSQQNQDLYLDKVAIRILHTDKISQIYSPSDLQDKALFMDMPTMAIFDLVPQNGHSIIQITFFNSPDVSSNYVNNRFALDVKSDIDNQPINTKTNNLKSANQSLSNLIWLMSKNGILDFYQQKIFGMWDAKASVSKDKLPNVLMDLATKDPIFTYAK